MPRELQAGQAMQQAQRCHVAVSEPCGGLAGQHGKRAEAAEAAQHAKIAGLGVKVGLQKDTMMFAGKVCRMSERLQG